MQTHQQLFPQSCNQLSKHGLQSEVVSESTCDGESHSSSSSFLCSPLTLGNMGRVVHILHPLVIQSVVAMFTSKAIGRSLLPLPRADFIVLTTLSAFLFDCGYLGLEGLCLKPYCFANIEKDSEEYCVPLSDLKT